MERTDKDTGHAGAVEHVHSEIGGAAGLLTPGEVARLFGVDPKTVSRWADAGKLEALRTLGGHRRYRMQQVSNLLSDDAIAS